MHCFLRQHDFRAADLEPRPLSIHQGRTSMVGGWDVNWRVMERFASNASQSGNIILRSPNPLSFTCHSRRNPRQTFLLNYMYIIKIGSGFLPLDQYQNDACASTRIWKQSSRFAYILPPLSQIILLAESPGIEITTNRRWSDVSRDV